ncbi:hypothetical protein RRG08_034780 [Elysia crispata]|uniref:Uncharacterized protein n=1 Tax=Elysia crispata TaxID=231223 RepID=A0AAE0YB04_9GAST|nr:hypothetical protein RRG08_034780 [Elysia crispata]
MKVLLVSLGLAAILTVSHASVCSKICHTSCDTGEDIYSRWMDMTPEEISESADECNEVCDPVCDCLNDCIIKCFLELRDCRIRAGNGISSIISCQTQFSKCGAPCDDQCASAVTMAGTKVISVRDRVMTSLRNFVYHLVEQIRQSAPKQQRVNGSAEESSAEESGSEKKLSVTATDSEEKPSVTDNDSGEAEV